LGSRAFDVRSGREGCAAETVSARALEGREDSNPRLPGQKSGTLPMSQQLKGIKNHRSVYEMVWRWTKRAPTTCLRSRRSPGGDQCPQAARIVNQDVLVREVLWAVPYRPLESGRKPAGVH